MYYEKSTKIKCFWSIFVTTHVWIATWFQLDVTDENYKLLCNTAVFLPAVLQVFAIILAISAIISSTKKITRKGSIISLVYSILSFVFFLIVSALNMISEGIM